MAPRASAAAAVQIADSRASSSTQREEDVEGGTGSCRSDGARARSSCTVAGGYKASDSALHSCCAASSSLALDSRSTMTNRPPNLCSVNRVCTRAMAGLAEVQGAVQVADVALQRENTHTSSASGTCSRAVPRAAARSDAKRAPRVASSAALPPRALCGGYSRSSTRQPLCGIGARRGVTTSL
eukprot:6416086-Prymnesium_polylepis.1